MVSLRHLIANHKIGVGIRRAAASSVHAILRVRSSDGAKRLRDRSMRFC
jgi:hypothetical protein